MAPHRGERPSDDLPGADSRSRERGRLFGGGLSCLRTDRLAEGVGFEPAVPCGTAVFKTAALSHSATPPDFGGVYLRPNVWRY
jgi:hypothetical protein